MTFNTLATRIPLYNNFSGVGEKGTPSGTQDASSIKQHQITLWENYSPPIINLYDYQRKPQSGGLPLMPL